MEDPVATPDTPSAQPPAKVFTQDEVNTMMGRVRAEERGKYKDYPDLKKRAAVADKLENDKLTEREKLEQQLAAAQRQAIDTDARIAAVAIRAEVRLRATQKGVVDPDAAYALIDRTGILYEDDNVKGVDAALDALIASKPYLKGSLPIAPNLNPGGNPGPAPVKLTDAERTTARRFGMTDEQYGKHKHPNPG